MKPPRRLHLEIQTHRSHPVGLIRSSYRDPDSHAVKHTQHGRITGLSLDQLKLIQAAFQGEVVPKGDPDTFQCTNSKEYGASYAVLEMARQLDLDTLLYSRNESWVRDCLAMIAGRIVYAGSKLALSNQWKNSALWELCGVQGEVDVEDHCYQPMDRLLERRKAIQKALAKKHLRNGHVVLYDITRSYLRDNTSRATSCSSATIGMARKGMSKSSWVCSATSGAVRWGWNSMPATPRMPRR